MKLWLVRHARPEVAAGTCYGALDIAADAEATKACAAELHATLPPHARIVASPLQRCAVLATALASLRPGASIKTDARLQEMNFGAWEGQPWHAISRTDMQAWTSNFENYAAGGTGESVGVFMARVAAAFDELRQAQEPREPRETVWITHAGVIRAMELIAGGRRRVDDAAQWPLYAPEYGQWRTLELVRTPKVYS